MENYRAFSIRFYFFAFILFLSCNSAGVREYKISKSARSYKGMVVSAHPLASEVGISILKQGGNAADAAIAVQLALAVVYPRAGNLGGGGFLVYRDSVGLVSSLDFREKAPLAAFRDMYLDSSGVVSETKSRIGILASAIPGTVAGLVETHKKLGKLQPWSKLVAPAIELAEKGFRITGIEADRFNTYQEEFALYNPPEMPFLSDTPWKAGDLLIQKELASTLRLIADHGHEGFYSGNNATKLIQISNSLNGLITQNDLSEYQAIWRKPMSLKWRQYTLYTMGLPSSGGIVLGQILSMIEPYLKDSLGHRDPSNVHLMVEAERRAYADRSFFLGDSDFYHVGVDSLLDKRYISEKLKDFNPDSATISRSIYTEQFNLSKESFETTHLSIVDEAGNAASVTTTLNDNFGCKVWIPGGGYFLNSEMDDFSSKPGHPNLFGLIGGEANSIAPGKRMLSSMTPTIIEKEGELWMVLGTPGGSTIITSVLQVFLHAAAFGMNIDQAVQENRFHHQWLPDEITYEKNAFSPELTTALIQKGHVLKPVEYIGMIEAIQVDKDGLLHGAADRRSDDHAAGW